MHTYIELEDQLFADLMRLGGFPDRNVAVNAAIREYVRPLQRREILKLRGKIRWRGDLDQLRRRRR
ncbi:MAG: type II toxin-antitoxin system VapB family antitoxin [Steroidobacteraceae bacterium]